MTGFYKKCNTELKWVKTEKVKMEDRFKHFGFKLVLQYCKQN